MSETKTGLSALNEMLFEQLERLQNDDMSEDEFEKEIKRARSMKDISNQILEAQNLAFRVMKYADEYGYDKNDHEMTKMLGVKE